MGSEACRNGMPSLSELMGHPFFDVSMPIMEKATVKIPSKLKEALREAKENIDKRLKEEQKLVRQYVLLYRSICIISDISRGCFHM